MKPSLAGFPWPSSLLALAIVGWQLALVLGYGPSLPPLLAGGGVLPIAAVALLAFLALDVMRYRRGLERQREQIGRFQRQIDELFDTRRELGERARTYSAHADKLKLFISERLLEYIEYDEKFLHFKNIAAEVRHNGVISYDKVQTALAEAAREREGADAERFRDAADSMLYLWDLLDLATTDNIALHVANRIYDSEEHYYQSMLRADDAEASPLQPTFAMSHALGRALAPIGDPEGSAHRDSAWPAPGLYSDDNFTIELRADGELLGNENHVVLLIENLLNNALFYSRRKGHRDRHSRVGIVLERDDGTIELRVYNRGPRIREDERDKIYQLGFSSRRIREHHGKGLGLYFVDQIVRGFEGSIEFANIVNDDDRVTLAVKLGNGELLNLAVEIPATGGKPLCREAGSGAEPARRVEWSFPALVSSIEVGLGANRQPLLISGLDADASGAYTDPRNPLRPRWLLELRNGKRSAKLFLQPLDRRGVEFVVRLPGADARLDQPA